jgi:hypothetical protein
MFDLLKLLQGDLWMVSVEDHNLDWGIKVAYNRLQPVKPLPLHDPPNVQVNQTVAHPATRRNDRDLCNSWRLGGRGRAGKPLGHDCLARLLKGDDIEFDIFMRGADDFHRSFDLIG